MEEGGYARSWTGPDAGRRAHSFGPGNRLTDCQSSVKELTRERERERKRERRGRAFPSFEAPFFRSRFSSIFLPFFFSSPLFSRSGGGGKTRDFPPTVNRSRPGGRGGGGSGVSVCNTLRYRYRRESIFENGRKPVPGWLIAEISRGGERRQSRRRREFPVRGGLGHVTRRGLSAAAAGEAHPARA